MDAERAGSGAPVGVKKSSYDQIRELWPELKICERGGCSGLGQIIKDLYKDTGADMQCKYCGHTFTKNQSGSAVYQLSRHWLVGTVAAKQTKFGPNNIQEYPEVPNRKTHNGKTKYESKTGSGWPFRGS